jgi:hypothetical protein
MNKNDNVIFSKTAAKEWAHLLSVIIGLTKLLLPDEETES